MPKRCEKVGKFTFAALSARRRKSILQFMFVCDILMEGYVFTERKMQQFGKRMKELRKNSGLTQSELAEKLNLHPQTVSKWERGLSQPDISQLGELAAVLGVTLEKICGQEETGETFSGNFDAQRFGKLISKQRALRGESQEQLAEAMLTSTDTVSRWERGVTCPDMERLTALAGHFNMPVSRMYCGVEEGAKTESVVLAKKRRHMAWALVVVAALCIFAAAVFYGLLLRPSLQEYTVTVDGQAVSVKKNDWFTSPAPSRDGYDFLGWADESGAEIVFPIKVTGDCSYHSVFAPHAYTVDYWLNGGYFEGFAQTFFTVESGTLELPVPEKTGQLFQGWYLTADYSGEPVEQIDCRGEDVQLYAKWSSAVFTVRYELDGGALYAQNPASVTAETEQTLAEPVRAGYCFLGWYDQPQGGEKYESVGGAKAKNLTLYALWQKTVEQFTVYYDTAGGTAEGENPVSVGAGEVHKLWGVKKTGYDFLGWNTEKDGSGEYMDYLYGVDETLYLYAVFTEKKFVIRYVHEGAYEGTETNPNEIFFGQTVDLLPVSLYGWKFLGWYDSESGGTKVARIDRTNILTITELYARFEPLEFKVDLHAGEGTFAANSGEETDITVTLQFGESIVLPQCSLQGYDFLGWNDSPDGKGEYFTSFSGMEGDEELYAVYRAKEFLIRYVYDGMYESGKINPNYIVYGTSVQLYPVYRYGYAFLGWYSAEQGGKKVERIDESNILDLSVLYARFEPLRFDIALDAGEGVFETPEGEESKYTFSVLFGETFVLPECTRGGYVFLGWQDEGGETVQTIDSLNIRDMRLTADWRESDKRYAVKYVLNGGDLEQPNPTEVLCGQIVALNEPKREGYTFLGWYDDAQGKGTRYEATQPGRETDLILYAIWQEIVVSGSYEDFRYEKNASSVTITDYTGKYGGNVDLIIPSVIDGLPVVEIKRVNSERSYTLRSVTIPYGIVRISDYAFYKINFLQPVVIPASVEVLEKSCFSGCTFSQLSFAEGSRLNLIGERAFYDATMKSSVLVLPEGLDRIGSSAFCHSRFYGIQLPETLRVIEGGGLVYYGYTSLYLPASVQTVASNSVFCGMDIYTALSKEETDRFPQDWHTGFNLTPSSDNVYTGVVPVTLTLHVDGKIQTMQGNAFDLPFPEKEGFVFLGWQDEAGVMQAKTYQVLTEDTHLYAVFAERGEADGFSAETPRIFAFNTQYTFTMPYASRWYFKLDTDKPVRITVSCSIRGYGFYYYTGNIRYVSEQSETNDLSQVFVYTPGEYFILQTNEYRDVQDVILRITLME